MTLVVAPIGVYARGKFCGNLKVYRSFELLCFPARQAPTVRHQR